MADCDDTAQIFKQIRELQMDSGLFYFIFSCVCVWNDNTLAVFQVARCLCRRNCISRSYKSIGVNVNVNKYNVFKKVCQEVN